MELIKKELIFIDSNASTVDQALTAITNILADNYKVAKTKVMQGLKAREKEMPTALENGFSIPHAVVAGLEQPVIVVAKWEKEIDWSAPDKKPVDTSIAIFVPEGARDEHLKILGKVSTLLLKRDDQDKFKSMSDKQIIDAINSLNADDTKNVNKGSYDIVAVTSCPTGVAHTFMAAEALEIAAKELGYTIKVEKQGQSTVDHLTQDEINGAKHIIFAVGKSIDESRFGGRKVHRTSVQAPIKDGASVINEAVKGLKLSDVKSSVRSTGGAQQVNVEAALDFENFGARIWNGVLAGVSYMLPFVVVGGIMVALSFLIDMPKYNEMQELGMADQFGNYTAAAHWVNQFGSLAFGMMVPILTAYLMYSMVGRQGLVVGFVIGYIAIGSGPNWIEAFNYNGWSPEAMEGSTAASGFIGGIAGGVMASAIIILLDQMWNRILPDSLQGAKMILILPFSAVAIAGIAFWFINIPLTFVSWGLFEVLDFVGNLPGGIVLFGLVAGAMACVDYGGPVNKAAYIFGVTTLASAGSTGSIWMASVSAACIIPPLGIALATCFGRKTLWDDQDIAAGYTNWILGATHITEGAIPFATKYAKDIYIQTMISGAITAALVGLAHIGTMAPHGGVLTFALLKVDWVSDPLAQMILGIILYVAILIFGICLQATLILISRKRTVKKEQTV